MGGTPAQYGDVSAENVPAKYAAIGANDAEYNRAFGNMQRGKIDGNIITAVKAQVALFAASPAYQSAGAMTWEQAAKYAADYLKIRGGLSANVDPTGWKWFANKDYIKNYKFTDPDPVEIVWRGVVGESHDMESDNYPPSLYGHGRINPTQNLVDAFPAASGYPIASAPDYDAANPYENRDPRLKMYILVNGDVIGAENKAISTASDATTIDGLNKETGASTTTGFYMRKLLRDDVNLNPNNTTNQRHFGARIRTTEILLDYAEAANEAQGPTANVGGASFSAYDVIKALRARVHEDGWSDSYLESIKNDKDKMRQLIRNERRIELCFENHRFWDLRRWKANLTETAKGVNISTNSSTGALNYRQIDVEPRQYQDYMIYGPIPYSELRKWSNLQQNDGWTIK